MNCQYYTDEIELCLAQVLTAYEVIPANFGWHIHQGDAYYGILQYQDTKGWQGDALSQLPLDTKEQLKKSVLDMHSTMNFTQLA